MSGFAGLFAGIWNIWTASLGTMPYWNPYGAVAVPVVMVLLLGTLGWLAFRKQRDG